MGPVFIHDSCSGYHSLLDDILLDYRSSELVLLCGAGISFDKPSCLPGGKSLKDGLVSSMISSLISLGIDVDSNYVQGKLVASPLELLLDAFVDAFGRDALDYLKTLDSVDFNLNHLYIAKLVTGNNNFKVITLNFDVLIECALDLLDVNYTVVCPLSNNLKRESNSKNSEIELVKVHGTFGLPNEKEGRLRDITTTVSEIRDKPDDRTINVLERIFRKSPKVLVAGYNGEDWDILPILSVLGEEISDLEIYWLKHQEQQDVIRVFEGREPSFEDPVPQVSDLLNELGNRAHLLYGDAQKLMADLLKETANCIDPRIVSEIENAESKDRELDISRFNQDKCVTALGVASLLLESEPGIAKKVFDSIGNNTEIADNPYYLQAYCNKLAWWCYIDKQYDDGIKLRNKALWINRKILKKKIEEVAHDVISTGYQLISYAKPRLFSIVELIRIPYHLIRGFYYLFIGEKIASSPTQKARSRYYRIDFLHNWYSFLLLFNNPVSNFVRKLGFKHVHHLYDKTNKKYPGYMEREYFYMRQIEAQVLAGSKPVKTDVENNLAQIERYFRSTQHNLDHLRNICITKAFLSYSVNPHCQTIKDYIQIAQFDKKDLHLKTKGRSDGITEDASAQMIFETVKDSSDERTMSKSAIGRYKLLERFFFPKKVSIKDVVDSMRTRSQ